MDPETRSQLEIKAQIIQNKVLAFCQDQAKIHLGPGQAAEKEYILDCFEKMRRTVKLVGEFYPES